MCTKCIEFDNKIARYMRLASQITEPTSDAILQMIERMKAEKAALHGEQWTRSGGNRILTPDQILPDGLRGRSQLQRRIPPP